MADAHEVSQTGGTGLRSESAAPEPGRSRAVAGTSAAVVLGLAWLAWFGVLQWSVVRFRVPIVLTLTVCAALFAWWLARRCVIDVPRWLAPSVLLGSVVITLTVPLFSYVRGGWLTAALAILTTGGLVCAVLLTRPGRATALAAYVVAVLTHTALAAVAVIGDRAPKIDVWARREPLHPAVDRLPRRTGLLPLPAVDVGAHRSRPVARR